MTTGLAALTNGLTSLLGTTVFPAIMAGLEKKGVKVTSDELFEYMNLTKPSNFSPEVPSYLGASNATAPAASSTRTRSTKDNPNVAKCTYILSKGLKKGQFCGAPCAPNSTKFCKACLKKKNGGGAPTAESSVTPSNPQTKAEQSATDENVLDAFDIDISKGLYRESKYNILIQQAPNGTTYAKGVIMNNSIEDLRPLNEAERIFCQERHIMVDDQQAKGQTKPQEQVKIQNSTPNLDSVLKGLIT